MTYWEGMERHISLLCNAECISRVALLKLVTDIQIKENYSKAMDPFTLELWHRHYGAWPPVVIMDLL